MSRLLVTVIGGASGVGKSTLLERVEPVSVVNTGTLFKTRMALADRDAVRQGAWSDFEEIVSDDLCRAVTRARFASEDTVIDTHFSAKLFENYRLGLQRPLIYKIARASIEAALAANGTVRFNVVLINCDPHSLLRRRRLDSSRKRELFPADCVNAVRQNRASSLKYVFEFRRAIADMEAQAIAESSYAVIENDSLDLAAERLSALMRG